MDIFVYLYFAWVGIVLWLMLWPDKNCTTLCYWKKDTGSDEWHYISECTDTNGHKTVYIDGILQ